MADFVFGLIIALIVTPICYFGFHIVLIWSILIGLVIGFGGILIATNTDDIFW